MMSNHDYRIEERARARYAADERSLSRAVTDQERLSVAKAARLSVMLTGWPVSIVARMQRSINNGDRIDVAIIEAACWAFIRTYSAFTSFLSAHTLGLSGRKTINARRQACVACSFRVTQADGGQRKAESSTLGPMDYCGVRRCRCPKAKWWPFATLRHLTRLRAVRCPKGGWGRSGSRRVPASRSSKSVSLEISPPRQAEPSTISGD